MQAGVSPARQTRTRLRHELRSLTYVTLDQANGGIIRNLSHDGIAVQLVAAVRPRQQMRVRFELRYPRLRVETRGEVAWATFSGQCGIRFLDLPPRVARQIDEWIFGSLLECIPLHSGRDRSIFAASKFDGSQLDATQRFESFVTSFATTATVANASTEDDGLMVSAAPLKVIELPVRPEPREPAYPHDHAAEISPSERFDPEPVSVDPVSLDWLSQPLSSRGLAWTVNTLAVVAGLLLFALVFLSITREAPKWPMAISAGAAIFVTVLYWGFFKAFGGLSLGARLARMAGSDGEEDEEERAARFR